MKISKSYFRQSDKYSKSFPELTDELLAAQAYIFFMAGFETSSTAMTYALYELALHPEIQDKLHGEIREALETHDGQLPYEATEKLEYLDKVYKGK